MAHHFILLRLNPFDLRVDKEGWWFEHSCVIVAGLLYIYIYIYLSKDEISLLAKGRKFIPTPKHINKALIKEEFETYGRKLRLMWH